MNKGKIITALLLILFKIVFIGDMILIGISSSRCIPRNYIYIAYWSLGTIFGICLLLRTSINTNIIYDGNITLSSALERDSCIGASIWTIMILFYILLILQINKIIEICGIKSLLFISVVVSLVLFWIFPAVIFFSYLYHKYKKENRTLLLLQTDVENNISISVNK